MSAPARPPRSRPPRSTALWFVGVVLAATCWFGWDLAGEPYFIDEGADLAQTYYYRLAGPAAIDHPDWLHYAAYDRPPVFKVLIGAALRLGGRPVPTSLEPAERWWQDPGYRIEHLKAMLPVGRWVMLLGAALGCGFVFLLAGRVAGTTAGVLAATLLAGSPLYFTHARRAMPDCMVQGQVALTLWLAAAGVAALTAPGRRLRGGLGLAVAGILCGVTAATKLNGAVAAVALALAGAAWLLRDLRAGGGRRTWILAGGLLLAGTLSVAAFVAVNPFLYSRPTLPAATGAAVVVAGRPRTAAWLEETRRLRDLSALGRLRFMIDHRTGALAQGKELFPDDRLDGTFRRLRAVVVNGLGRWFAGGVEPGTRVPDADPLLTAGQVAARRPAVLAWGIPPWLLASAVGVLCLLGVAVTLAAGRREGGADGVPIAWLLLAWPAAETLLLVRGLTLDWDRYYLGTVAWASVLAAVGVGGTFAQAAEGLFLPLPSDEEPNGAV